MGRLGPVAVAVLALLAGCGSAVGPASPGTPTVTPAPVPSPSPAPDSAPTTPAPTATPSISGALPPGVTRAGIADVSALVRAHRAALDGRTYQAVSVVNRSTAGGWERTERVLLVDGDRTRVHSRTATGGNRSVGTEYLDDRGRFVRCGRAGAPEDCRTGSDPGGGTAGTVLALLSGSESSLAGTESRAVGTDRNVGTLRYRLRVGGTPYGLEAPYGVLEARNYTATAVVDPSGLVTDLEASYELVGGGDRIHVTVTLEFRDVGETLVTPPPWHRSNATGTPGGRAGAGADAGGSRGPERAVSAGRPSRATVP